MTGPALLLRSVLTALAVLIGTYVGDKDPEWYVTVPLLMVASVAVYLACVSAVLEDRRAR